MSTLTYIVAAEVRDESDTIEGKILSRPTLIYTDGINVTYGCDVDIGQEGVIDENGTLGILPLKNVPIASNNRELIYAEVGQAVSLSKNSAGKWEITGLSKSAPGSFIIVPVTVPQYCYGYPGIPGNVVPDPVIIIGDPIELSVESRLLTYGELSVYGVYGTIPYGAIGVFQNGELIDIR
ncbi:MAG: hypothetical protein ACWGQW_01185 [bacterium]